MARRKHSADRMTELSAELESIVGQAADWPDDAAHRAAAIAREALSIAQDALQEATAASTSATSAAAAEAVEEFDEARDSALGHPLATLLLAVGVGVLL